MSFTSENFNLVGKIPEERDLLQNWSEFNLTVSIFNMTNNTNNNNNNNSNNRDLNMKISE
jgi:hypothetical protein